jgi:hypothetical protein
MEGGNLSRYTIHMHGIVILMYDKSKIKLKIKKRQSTGGAAQTIQHLSHKHEALNSNPSTAKNKKASQ